MLILSFHFSLSFYIKIKLISELIYNYNVDEKGEQMQILTLELRTCDITKTREFYVDRLEFPLQHETKDSFTILTRETELTFLQETNGSMSFYHFAMTIPENKINEAKDWLIHQGCPLIDPTTFEITTDNDKNCIVFFQSINAHSVYFMDPAGNIVEFIARHNFNNYSTKPFDTTSIVNVSEIGLALKDNIPEVTPLLCSKLDISPFFGDGELIQALGDGNGAFILGDTTRPWFPTRRLPEIHPVHVTILGDTQEPFQLDRYPYYIDITNGK